MRVTRIGSTGWSLLLRAADQKGGQKSQPAQPNGRCRQVDDIESQAEDGLASGGGVPRQARSEQ